MSELSGGPERRRAVERFADESCVRVVQPRSLTWQQVAVDRLGEQGVPEGIAVTVGRLEHLVGCRLAERGVEVVAVEAARRCQQTMPDLPARRGRSSYDLLGWPGQLLDARQQDVGERGRKRAELTARLLAGAQREQQLLCVVGVALRPVENPADCLVVDRRAMQHHEVSRHLVVVERCQVDPLDHRQSGQLGEQLTQGVSPVQIVGAVAADNEQPLVAQSPDEKGEQVPSRLVGPVQILEHQEQRSLVKRRGPPQQPDDTVEQLQLPDVASRAVAQSQVAAGLIFGGLKQRAQRFGERQIGQADPADVETVAYQHGGTQIACLGDQLGQQACLAHASVSGQHHRGRLPGCRTAEGGVQRSQFLRTADQRRLEPRACHGSIVARRTDGSAPPEHLERPEAVECRRLIDLHRDRVEVALHHPRAERHQRGAAAYSRSVTNRLTAPTANVPPVDPAPPTRSGLGRGWVASEPVPLRARC